MNAFVREVFRWYRAYAKEYAGLATRADSHCGSVTFIQRAGSALNLNVHCHALVLDGVYLHEGFGRGGPIEFLALPAPRTQDVEEVLLRVRKKVVGIVQQAANEEADQDALVSMTMRFKYFIDAFSNENSTHLSFFTKTNNVWFSVFTMTIAGMTLWFT